MKRLGKLLGGLAMLAAAPAAATPASHDTAVQAEPAAIVGGAPTTASPAVATILMADANDNIFALCSGTLITPTVVLTAAHCVDDRVQAASRIVYFGTTLLVDPDPGFVFATRAKSVAFHPQWNPDALENGFDIGIVVLEDAAPIAPIPVNTTPLSAADRNTDVQLVGWGITGGGKDDSGAKRAVTSKLADFDAKLLLVGNPQTNTCSGDSGGPALAQRGGKQVVIGVTSFGDVDCGQIGVDTRVDAMLDFLVAQGIDVGPVPPPDPTPPAPPDQPDPDDPDRGDIITPTADDGGGCNATRSSANAAFLLVLCALLASRKRSTLTRKVSR